MVESDKNSVSRWIAALKQGDPGAAHKLWERYIEDVIRLARARLCGVPRAVVDEEDAALCAFDSFFRWARRGCYPKLDNREDLWRLLALTAERKAIDLSHHERRRKHGGGKRIGTLDQPLGDGSGDDPQAVPATQAPPDCEALLADECAHFLQSLASDSLPQVALMKLDGYTHQGIAERLGCSLRSVARKIERIRGSWRGASGNEP